MSLAETLLVIGTFGICTGVWVTLKVIVGQGKEKMCDCISSVATITKSKSKKESN